MDPVILRLIFAKKMQKSGNIVSVVKMAETYNSIGLLCYGIAQYKFDVLKSIGYQKY